MLLIMHYIQQKIMYVLALTDSARFSQLKPQEIESNLFIYHLRQLMRDKLVVKNTDKTYSLSIQGKAYADTINWKTLKPRSQPKIVNLIACKNDHGEYLLYRRKHQPFIGLTGFPYGKIHLGETITESSERELLDKTNLKTALKHRGDAYVTVFDGDELVMHTLFHIHTGENPVGELKEATPIGYCYWAKVDLDKPDQYFPGFVEIYSLLKRPAKQRFFKEFTFHL
ncbi:NUDIX domain-containing protein [Candidatus Microgenomates bacterium]|nr:NUDIX domain-containing protein [Candidatus Microgenomates bacterium]